MHLQPARTPTLAFGPFEYDPASGELSKHGYRVKLSSQPREILDALLERPGALVAREELRERLWPGAVAGDFEHGLNAAVNKLRQALGDSVDQPRYVETLPGRGYRFIAPMQGTVAPVREIPPMPVLHFEPKRESHRSWRTPAIGALALASVAGLAYWLPGRSPAPVRLKLSRARNPITFSKTVLWFRQSMKF